MPVGTAVRIYDLAREVKQDTKRVLEDLRREGADVSVPSNSVSKELAEKVRSRYFPKTETSPKRLIKVIKKVAKVEEPIVTEEVPQAKTEPQLQAAEEKVTAKQAETAKPSTGELIPKPVRKVTKLQKKIEVESIPDSSSVEGKLSVSEPTVETETLETPPELQTTADVTAEEQTTEKSVESKSVTSRVLRPNGTQVKILKLTQESLNKGIKPGDRMVNDAPTRTGKFNNEKEPEKGKTDLRKDGKNGRKPELNATKGETSTPQMTYTPPVDQRKKFGRAAAKKGGKRFEDKGGRFDERDLTTPRPRSIEDLRSSEPFSDCRYQTFRPERGRALQ